MSTHKKNHQKFLVFTVLSLSLFLLHSCGGSESAYAPSAQSGTVNFYITDSISDYKQVIIGINEVALVNSGTQTVCSVLTAPTSLDIPKLTDVLQLVDVVTCDTGPYNRVHLEFKPEVQLMDRYGSSAVCRLDSYLDNGGRVNKLQCDPVKDICTLDITGSVRRGSLDILAGQVNKVAVDFNLKDFSVTDFGKAGCLVTMKVTPFQAADIIRVNHPESISGIIADLDTAAMTFRLKKGGTKFFFSYADIAAARPDFYRLLQLAQDDVLKVWIKSGDLSADAALITADDILLMVSGRISGLDQVSKTFSLTYKGINTMTVSYASSDTIEGVPADGARVETKLYGYADAVYIAKSIKIKTDDSESDN